MSSADDLLDRVVETFDPAAWLEWHLESYKLCEHDDDRAYHVRKIKYWASALA